MKLVSPIAVAAVSLWLVASCGAVGPGDDETTEPTPGSGATVDGATDLTVVVKADSGKRTYTLVCDAGGGDHPDPAAACRSLSEMKDPFAPVPRDAMCTEIYGGPQTATVTGTFRGEPVSTKFSRTNGCEIARWEKHVALLVETGDS